MLHLAHIINPVCLPQTHELMQAQPITFASMRAAQQYAEATVKVSLLTAQYPEDHPIIPDYFIKTPDLQRSVMDFVKLEKPRKLPLLVDILAAVDQNIQADYYIYTNVDIGLMLPFYKAVAQILENEQLDAMVINRRRMSVQYQKVEDLDLIYADLGSVHTGYDCFIFRKEMMKQFILGNVCIGVPHFCNSLMHNLIAHSSRFKLYTKMHLTFHIGMELYKKWGTTTLLKYNYKIYRENLRKLAPSFCIARFPGANLPFVKRHFKWLMNPTFHYPTMLLLDVKQWRRKRPARTKNETPDFKHKYLNWLINYVNFE